MMNRRRFATALAVGATAALTRRALSAQSDPPARNVVLVHGLFADGSCWSEVIARLQAAGLNATAVQNPLTTLPEAVASAQRVLARQDGPMVLVGHSFSGMIVTEAGVHPNVSALVYVAARAPDAVQEPFHKALLTGKTTQAAWRSKPSWYAVSTEDRTINPDLQRFMAKRMGAKTIEIKASHLSLISQPDRIAAVISA